MKRIAGVEPQLRADFAAVSRQLGPQAPTLCEGWQTGDLLLHMNLIERRWDSWASVALNLSRPASPVSTATSKITTTWAPPSRKA